MITDNHAHWARHPAVTLTLLTLLFGVLWMHWTALGGRALMGACFHLIIAVTYTWYSVKDIRDWLANHRQATNVR